MIDRVPRMVQQHHDRLHELFTDRVMAVTASCFFLAGRAAAEAFN